MVKKLSNSHIEFSQVQKDAVEFLTPILEKRTPKVIILYGAGGTGKTFLLKALADIYKGYELFLEGTLPNKTIEAGFIYGFYGRRRIAKSFLKALLKYNMPVIIETNIVPIVYGSDETIWEDIELVSTESSLVATSTQHAVKFIINVRSAEPFTAKVDEKGRIMLRSDVRKELNITAGDKVRVIEMEKV